MTWNQDIIENSEAVVNPQSYDPGDLCWKGEQSYAGGGNHSPIDVETCSKHDESHFHLGNYYTYAAAVAMDDTTDIKEDKQAVTSSICPAGWQLPSLSGNRSYRNLEDSIVLDPQSPNWASGYIDEYHITSEQEEVPKSTMNIAPYYFLYGGFWDGSLRGIGYNTRYITNAVTSGVTAYSLYFNGHGGPDSQHGGDNRSEGYSIRCVLR